MLIMFFKCMICIRLTIKLKNNVALKIEAVKPLSKYSYK